MVKPIPPRSATPKICRQLIWSARRAKPDRCARNAKVKMKISTQFKSFEFANHYAVIRSIIDTTIKNGMNVVDALIIIAKIQPKSSN